MKQNWLSEFKKPGGAYRSKPFWAWNGKLEESELFRQISVMKRMGMGGFFVHSRTGLATPYLSNEWHKLVLACADEAKKHSMETWLYDEDRWPSGSAGGLVTSNLKFRQTFLLMEQETDPKALRWTADTLAVFTGCVDGTKATDIKRIWAGKRLTRLPTGHSLLVFRIARAKCSPWHNGYTYLDTLSHEAVRKFIQTTHDSYRKHARRHFGKTIPGIFTDEPNYGSCFTTSPPTAPWTTSLPRVFKARYGYDVIHHLPDLYFDIDGEDVSRVRYHYHDCITFLFVDAFARQTGQWCEKNNLLHTGHVLREETLRSQTSAVGSSMRFYEHMQAPGMDLLTEYRREYHTAKQVSSAARQFGRKWRLTETYGCTGWDFSFAGHKALGDWQMAMGINLRCPHLSWYTMEGQAKRDYPASISFQSPWWESYGKVEDYFARINLVMTRGEEVRDLLVIHPIESMWTMCRPGWENDKRVAEYDRSFAMVRDSLLMEHIDFDYGDEDIIARHGAAGGSKSAPVLIVGKAAYKAVLVPPLITIRQTTLDMLRKFHGAGGLVVFSGRPPAYIDATASSEAAEFADSCVRVPARYDEITGALAPSCRRLSITNGRGSEIPSVLYLLREDKTACYLFVCNTGHKRSQMTPELLDVPVRQRKEAFPHVLISGLSHCLGNPVELNPDSGEIAMADAKRHKGRWEIKTSFPSLGSRLFMIPRRRKKVSYPKVVPLREVRRISMDNTRWPVALSEDNNAVLDRPRYMIGKGKWTGPEEILRLDAIVRGTIGLSPRGGEMVQPWTRTSTDRGKRLPVQLNYEFEIETLPKESMFMALEQPARYRIALNENVLNADSDSGWWVDTSLRKLALDAAFLRCGKNKIELSCEYDQSHPGLEAVHLLGSFGVKLKNNSFSLVEMPVALNIGDWVHQHLPFYSGSVAYLCAINPGLSSNERLFLEVPAYEGAAVRVLVNGNQAGIIAWEPNELDITDHLRKGSNDLQIEVLGHRRNSHGPLHHSKSHPAWTGPDEFITDGNDWQDAYQLVPCGLIKAPHLSVRH